MRSYRSELPKDLQQLIASTEEGVERLYRSSNLSALKQGKKSSHRRHRSYEESSSESASTEYYDEDVPPYEYERRNKAKDYSGPRSNHDEPPTLSIRSRKAKGRVNPQIGSSGAPSFLRDEAGDSTPLTRRPGINVIGVTSSGHKYSDTSLNPSYSATNTSQSNTNDSISLQPMRTTFGRRWTSAYKNLITPPTTPQITPGSSPKSALPPPAVQSTPPPLQPGPQPVARGIQSAYEKEDGDAEGRSTGSPDPKSVTTDSASRSKDEMISNLKDKNREKEKEMLELKLAHAKEVAVLREAMVTARSEAAKEVAEQLAASYAVKQSLLQSSLEAESQRVSELEAEVRTLKRERDGLRKELEDKESNLLMYNRSKQLDETNQNMTREKISQLERFIDELKEIHQQNLTQIANAEEARRSALKRESELSEELRTTRQLLEERDEAAKQTLAQLEEEFNATSANYQELLSNTSERMSQLEKIERKYRKLKQENQAYQEGRDEIQEVHTKQVELLENEIERLNKENLELREQTILLENNATEAEDAHRIALSQLKIENDAKVASEQDKLKTVSQKLETANHTIELLQARIESLQDDLHEESSKVQSSITRAAEEQLKLNQELAEQQRKANSYKTHSEDIITTLKRQLKEKDAKLQALATSSNEPILRLRQQLEDERSRRAKLEEQFSKFKKRAKEAEEKAAHELRKEQLRHSTEMAAAQITQPTHTYTNNSYNNSNNRKPKPSPYRAMSQQEIPAGTSTPRQITQFASQPPLSGHSKTPKVQTTVALKNAPEVERSKRLHTDPVALKRRNQRPSRDMEFLSPPQVQTTTICKSSLDEEGYKGTNLEKEMVMALGSDRRAVPPVEGNTVDSFVSAIQGGTMDSLSDISKTSPWHSSSRLTEGEGGGKLHSPAINRQQSTSSGRSDRRIVSPPVERNSCEVPLDDGDQLIGEQVMYNASVSAHERKLNDFHANAADIFRKITNSRGDFVSQCVSLVKKTGREHADNVERHEAAGKKARYPVPTSSDDEDLDNNNNSQNGDDESYTS